MERRRLTSYRAECCLISTISGAASSAYGLSGVLCRWAGLAGVPEDSVHVFPSSSSSSSSSCVCVCMHVRMRLCDCVIDREQNRVSE